MRRRAVVPEARTRRDPDRQKNYERDQLQGQQGLQGAVSGFPPDRRPPAYSVPMFIAVLGGSRERRGSRGDDLCRQNHQITGDVRGEQLCRLGGGMMCPTP